MINYFIKCRDAELRNKIYILSQKYGDESAINIILNELDIEIKGHIVIRANSLADKTAGLFFVSYSKNYTKGDIGVSQCGIKIMDKEGRS